MNQVPSILLGDYYGEKDLVAFNVQLAFSNARFDLVSQEFRVIRRVRVWARHHRVGNEDAHSDR